jgi:hypothetical protein
MSRATSFPLKNTRGGLEATDVFYVCRFKNGKRSFVPIKGLNFDSLVFGDPTILESSLEIVGDLKVEGLAGNEGSLLMVDNDGNVVIENHQELSEYDSVNTHLLYVGTANYGVAEGDLSWRIAQVNTLNGDVLFADGNENYDNSWTLREGGSYS